MIVRLVVQLMVPALSEAAQAQVYVPLFILMVNPVEVFAPLTVLINLEEKLWFVEFVI